MFAHDRDLLVHEPGLLREAAWAGQKLFAGPVEVELGKLAVTSYSGLFDSDAARPGGVLLLDNAPVEILSIDHGFTASVSMIRARDSDQPLQAWWLGQNADVECITFRPQIAMVHGVLLRAAGLVAGDTPHDQSTLGADRVTNPGDLRHAEAVGALAAVYAAAAPLADPTADLFNKAKRYADEFARVRRSLRVAVDTTGDGRPDDHRPSGVIQMKRTS